MKHYTNEGFSQMRECVTSTFAWDMALSEGDSLREKGEDLISKVQTMCLHKNGENPAIVISGKNIGSFFVTNREFTPIFERVNDDITLCGKFERSCGSNGYCTDFYLYEFKKCPADEVLVFNHKDPFGENKINLIKIFNGIAESEEEDV